MPGVSGGVRANINFDTGQADVWRQIGNLAATGMDVATKLYVQQAEDQLQEAVLQAEEEDRQLANRLRTNTDESTYDAELEKTLQIKKKYRPKNNMAGRGYDSYLKSITPSLREGIKESKQARLTNKYFDSRDIVRDKAIETGNLRQLEVKNKIGVSLGYTDEKEAGRYYRDAEQKAQYDEALRRVEDNPEGYKNAKDKQVFLEGLNTVTSDPGKMMAMNNIAKGFIAEREIEKGRITLAQTATIKKAATDPVVTVDFMQKKIAQSDGLTPEQKITSMNLFTQSRQTMARGGSNAYTTTENWSLYSEHRERAAKRTITEQEIMDNVGPGGYSWPQAEKLIGIINGKDSSSKAFEDSAAAKNLTAQIKAMLPVTGAIIDRTDIALNQFANQRGLSLLEDAIQNNPNWTDREKKEEALRIGRQLEREYDDGTLELGLERALEMTTEQRARQIEQDLNKINLSEIKKLGRGIPQPKTKAEFDKLSSGTIFIDPDGVRRRKP